MHVDCGLDPGSQVELLGRALVGRPGALGSEDLGPRVELAPARDLFVARPDDPGAQGLGNAPVAGQDGGERLHERVRRVQRRAAEDSGVQIALAGSHAHVEVGDAPGRNLEHGDAGLEHVTVEDHAGVSPTLVRLEEVHDRIASGLLLAVAGEPDVHRQRALGREQRRCLQLEVELALVVGDPSRVEPAVPHGGVERRRLPPLERLRRLDVEVPVGDDGRRAVGILRGPDLTDHERLVGRVLELGLPAGRADEVAYPFPRAPNILRVHRISADAGDAKQLEELLQPICRRLSHKR